MAFEPVFEQKTLAGYKRLCCAQAVVEARLPANAGANIAKVLSIATECTVNASEVFAGEARYHGRVNFKVIFTDPEGKNHSMDYNADFTDKLLGEEIQAGQKAVLSAHVLDTDILSVDERELKLACVVETAMDAVVFETVNALTKGGENIYTHEDRVEFVCLLCENTAALTVTGELKDLKNGKVLLSEARAITAKRRAGQDVVFVEGSIFCDLTCEDEAGMIYSLHYTAPFIEEIPAIGAREGNSVVAGCSLNSHSVTVETDGQACSAALEFVLTGFVKVFADDVFHPIVDAFSVTNELRAAGRTLGVYKHKHSGSFDERVEGSVTLDINMPIADSISAITGSKLTISTAIAGEGSITYDGIVSANIIYYSAEANVKNSVAVELPFSIAVHADYAAAGDAVSAKGIVTNWTTKILRGNVLQLKADIEVDILVNGEEPKFILTELAVGDERVLPTAAFSVHIANAGESLWDVAKALGMTPEIVLVQNPSLSLPLSGGERVLAYRQKVRG